ncbi:MAG: tetratricopeptide repeat protein [Bacteroidaceae bacterium]|nr:tetratricopeptide repeat protein [Bacteroidaceae bacterium]
MAKKHQSVPVNEFDKTLAASSSFVERNKKAIMYCTCTLLVVVIAVVLAVQYYIKPRNLEAAESMAVAEQLYRSGDFEKALNGQGQDAGFLQIMDEFTCTPSANLARLYAGLSYAHLGKYQEAVDYLEDYSDCGDDMISNAAIGALGNCYAELGQPEKAAATLLKAADKASNNTLSPIYYVQAGQIFESLNQNDKAIECYEKVKKNYPGSPQAQEIEKFIEHLK